MEHALETYPMPPRGPNGLRLSPESNRYAAYMDLTATGVLRHSECWVAATDGALPGRGVRDKDDTLGPITVGGGISLVPPAEWGPDAEPARAQGWDPMRGARLFSQHLRADARSEVILLF